MNLTTRSSTVAACRSVQPDAPPLARAIGWAAALAVAVTLVACGGGGDNDQLRTHEGASTSLGQGTARAWVTVDAQDRPQAVGCVFQPIVDGISG